jgi:site-specific recombinase XerD
MSTSPTEPIVTTGDLAVNATSFARHIRAANLSPATQRTYLASIARLADFLTAKGMPTDVANVRREHLEAFMEDQLASWKPATAANRYSGIRPFFAWLLEEGEIRDNPMARMRKPKLPEHAPPVLTAEEQERIRVACKPRSKEDFPGFRDSAIVETFLSTGARLSELANLRWTPDNPDTNDLDLDRRMVRIREGKGRRERVSFLNDQAVKALDRYVRRRARQRKANLPWLWLGEKGRMTDSGIAQALRRRGRAAGVPGLHAHQFRHSYAHDMLSKGMQETDLMTLAGWRSREMLSRYARSAAASRALDAARRLSEERE